MKHFTKERGKRSRRYPCKWKYSRET